jgi:protein-tyrosine phosphatase
MYNHGREAMKKRWRIAAIAGLVTAGLALGSRKQLVGAIRQGTDIIVGRLREQGLRPMGLWIRDHGLRRIQGMSPVDTSQVAPGLFVGGQHYRHGLPQMAALNISATLSLREEADDTVRGVALARHLWLPAVDDTPPTLDQLSRAVEFTRQSLSEGRGVYIHCTAGVGRAPTTAAAYLVSTGLTPAEAWALIRRTRPFIRPRSVQVDQVDRFYEEQGTR